VFIFTSDDNPTRAIRCAPEFRGTIQNVFEIPPQRNNEFASIHAATFPVAFPVAFIGSFCPVGGSVIDLFAGTGTTTIAAETTGRRSFAMEIDPRYADIVLKRWEDFAGQTAVLIAPAPSTAESSPSGEASGR
jgi:DNA modification methylase